MSVAIVMARRSAALPANGCPVRRATTTAACTMPIDEHPESHGDDRSAERGEIDRQGRQHPLEASGAQQADPDPDGAADQPDDRGRQQQRAGHPA